MIQSIISAFLLVTVSSAWAQPNDLSQKIAYPSFYGNQVYNFWTDPTHPKGIWRRTSVIEYKKPDSSWEILLDLDALAASESENWVWRGVQFSGGEETQPPRVLIQLSRGPAAAHVTREFDLNTKSFSPDGFTLPEAMSSTDWIDENTLLVATDFGPGSLTKFGYPRIAKIWKRGTPLSEAKTIFVGAVTDQAIDVKVYTDHQKSYPVIFHLTAFFEFQTWWIGPHGLVAKLPIPPTANLIGFKDDRVLFVPLKEYLIGSEIRLSAGSILAQALSGPNPLLELIFTPDSGRGAQSVHLDQQGIFAVVTENIQSRAIRFRRIGNRWSETTLPFASNGSIRWVSCADNLGLVAVTYEDDQTPQTLYFVDSQDQIEAIKP